MFSCIISQTIFLLSVAPATSCLIPSETPVESSNKEQQQNFESANDTSETANHTKESVDTTAEPVDTTKSSKDATEQTVKPETSTEPSENSAMVTSSSSTAAQSEIKKSEPVKKTETVVASAGNKPKSGEEKTEGTKGDGESESLEVLVDDTQNDLDADLQKSEGSEISEAKLSGDGDGTKSGDATEATDEAKTTAVSENKTGDGESKQEEKKPDDAKRLVGFV